MVTVTPSPLAAGPVLQPPTRRSAESSPSHSHSHSHSQMSRNSSRKSNNSVNCRIDGKLTLGAGRGCLRTTIYGSPDQRWTAYKIYSYILSWICGQYLFSHITKSVGERHITAQRNSHEKNIMNRNKKVTVDFSVRWIKYLIRFSSRRLSKKLFVETFLKKLLWLWSLATARINC